MSYADRELLQSAARGNWRGVKPEVLVCEIQELKDKIEMLERYPDEAIGFDCPGECSRDEWIEDHRYFWQSKIDNLQAEIQRRRILKFSPQANTDPEIIQTIKTQLPMADVIEWYTEVVYLNRDQYKFRCNLHGDGQDKNPSGVIYNKENRYWCFVCNKGGDIFDAVQAWEHCELSTAIAKLARYLGLDMKPLISPPRLLVKGGAVI